MAFAEPSDLILRYDSRRLVELLSDSGEPLDVADLDSDTTLAALLEDATAEIRSAVRVSDRYTETELDTIATKNVDSADDSPALYFLIRLTCDLTYGYLCIRRGYDASAISSMAPAFVEAKKTLQLLREGERIFPTEEAADAGLPHSTLFRSVDPVPPPLTSEAYRIFGDRAASYPPRR